VVGCQHFSKSWSGGVKARHPEELESCRYDTVRIQTSKVLSVSLAAQEHVLFQSASVSMLHAADGSIICGDAKFLQGCLPDVDAMRACMLRTIVEEQPA
jgi:hypothetical protein